MKAGSMVARIRGSIGRCMVCVTLSLSAATFAHDAEAIEKFASGRKQFAAGRASVHKTVQLLLSESQLRLHLRDDLHFQCEVKPYRKPRVQHDVGVTFGLHYEFR